jgi:hypothetical protein
MIFKLFLFYIAFNLAFAARIIYVHYTSRFEGRSDSPDREG